MKTVTNKLNVSVLSCHFNVDSLAAARSKFKLPVRFFQAYCYLAMVIYRSKCTPRARIKNSTILMKLDVSDFVTMNLLMPSLLLCFSSFFGILDEMRKRAKLLLRGLRKLTRIFFFDDRLKYPISIMFIGCIVDGCTVTVCV